MPGSFQIGSNASARWRAHAKGTWPDRPLAQPEHGSSLSSKPVKAGKRSRRPRTRPRRRPLLLVRGASRLGTARHLKPCGNPHSSNTVPAVEVAKCSARVAWVRPSPWYRPRRGGGRAGSTRVRDDGRRQAVPKIRPRRRRPGRARTGDGHDRRWIEVDDSQWINQDHVLYAYLSPAGEESGPMIGAV